MQACSNADHCPPLRSTGKSADVVTAVSKLLKGSNATADQADFRFVAPGTGAFVGFRQTPAAIVPG